MTPADKAISPPIRLATWDKLAMWRHRDILDKFEILLDGVVQHGVCAYDCEACYVDRERHDEQGNIVVDRRVGIIVRDLLQGEVTVRWKAGYDAA